MARSLWKDHLLIGCEESVRDFKGQLCMVGVMHRDWHYNNLECQRNRVIDNFQLI